MKHTKTLAAVLFLALFLASCQTDRITSYEQGVSQMESLQDKYGATFEKSPPTPQAISSLSSELSSLRLKVTENLDTEPLLLLIDYRMNLLESDRLLLEGFKWGAASTTEPGFGCKRGSERILNSSQLRNSSANAGHASLASLQQFVNAYPDQSKALNLSQRTILTLTTTFAIVQNQAEKDHRIIMNFCFGNITVSESPSTLDTDGESDETA